MLCFLNTFSPSSLFGLTQPIHGVQLEIESHIWGADDGKARKTIIGLSSTQIQLQKFLKILYPQELLVQPWITMEKAGRNFVKMVSLNDKFSNTYCKHSNCPMA